MARGKRGDKLLLHPGDPELSPGVPDIFGKGLSVCVCVCVCVCCGAVRLGTGDAGLKSHVDVGSPIFAESAPKLDQR